MGRVFFWHPACPNLIMKGDHMSPANPGESVREQLAARSTEKALSGRNKESTEEQKSAFAAFLKEKARKKRRPWK